MRVASRLNLTTTAKDYGDLAIGDLVSRTGGVFHQVVFKTTQGAPNETEFGLVLLSDGTFIEMDLGNIQDTGGELLPTVSVLTGMEKFYV